MMKHSSSSSSSGSGRVSQVASGRDQKTYQSNWLTAGQEQQHETFSGHFQPMPSTVLLYGLLLIFVSRMLDGTSTL
jgi:hypothetical protein